MSKSVIQIPNSIIRNEAVKLNATEFVMILFLKKYYFISGKKDTFEIDPKKLMCNVGIYDNRTFKKTMSNLYENGFLLNEVGKLPRGKPLEAKIDVSKLECKSEFTQLPTVLLDRISDIDCIGIRLLYFYESYINRKNGNVKYCYVSYSTISEMLGIGRQTINDVNDVLVQFKLLKITKHKLKTEYEYNQDDALVFDKWNNHYEVRLDQM